MDFKISCLQENLKRALSNVGHAVDTRSNMPILGSVRFSASQESLRLTTSNLQMSIIQEMPASIDEPGDIALPFRTLNNLANCWDNDLVSIHQQHSQPSADQLTGSGLTALLTCGKSNADLAAVPGAHFPPVEPVDPPSFTASVDPNILVNAINLTRFSIARQDSREVLNGLNIIFNSHSFTAVAADGFRLAVIDDVPLETGPDDPKTVNIPRDAVTQLHRLCSQEQEPVHISYYESKGQLKASIGDVILICQTIAGTFPNYSQLIPESSQNVTSVKSEALRSALSTASVMTDNQTNAIRMVTHANPVEPPPPEADAAELPPQHLLSLSAHIPSLGTSNASSNASADAYSEGDSDVMRVGVNHQYMQDIAAACPRDANVHIHTNGDSNPVKITVDKHPNYCYVMMPMRLIWDPDPAFDRAD